MFVCIAMHGCKFTKSLGTSKEKHVFFDKKGKKCTSQQCRLFLIMNVPILEHYLKTIMKQKNSFGCVAEKYF